MLPRYASTLVAAAALVLLAGCGSDDATDDSADDPSGEIASTGDQAPPTAPVADEGSETDAATDATSVCSPLMSFDLSAAFGGELQFGEVDEYASGQGCSAAVVGAEGDGLLVQLTIAENYDAKALYEEQDLPFSRLDGLGQEAFIVNEADLNVLIDDDTALVVALSAFFVGEADLPEPPTVQAGLVAIAEALLADL